MLSLIFDHIKNMDGALFQLIFGGALGIGLATWVKTH